jgi:chemotaxis protein methyltransferase CheR
MTIEYNEHTVNKISNLVYKHTGIVLGQEKKLLIENRFNRLINDLGIKTDTSIEGVLQNLEQSYLQDFINVFTTNKTNFFREIKQFEFLFKEILPKSFDKGSYVNIYCSASSTGEEPWSIVATCEAAKKKAAQKYCNYNILATDIDTAILKKAAAGKYQCKDFNKQAFPYWASPLFLFSDSTSLCRKPENHESTLNIKAELKSKVAFKQQNLMDPELSVPKNDFYDVVFCRNVLIYFSKEDQTKIVKKLLTKLKTKGYLFLGHSESIDIALFGLERLNNNIFRKI